MTPDGPPPASHLEHASFASHAAGAEVDYQVLLPADRADDEPLPLVLHLHGAMSSSASLEVARPIYDELRSRGELPRAVVACPSTPTLDGFYLDWEGAGRWATLVADEFPAYVAERYGPVTRRVVFGASMGGYGALKLAFSRPSEWVAVAALSPAVFPGETPADVDDEHLPSVLRDLHEAIGKDLDRYRKNCVPALARANRAAILSAGLPIWIDCGAADEFRLYDGAAYLDRLLTSLDIDHEFRLVEGAGHIGPEVPDRTARALRFLGAALREAELVGPADSGPGDDRPVH